MTINTITIKLFGQKQAVTRVLNAAGEVVFVGTKAECEGFVFDSAN